MRDPDAVSPGSTPQDSSLNTPTMSPHKKPGSPLCVVDVQLRKAECAGGDYTSVKIRRISGSTKDFHEAVHLVSSALEAEREKALEDSSPIDEGELM